MNHWGQRREQHCRSGIHPGLDRIRHARHTLALHPRVPLIHVVGTNGKGSACRYLEALALETGLRPGVFISPWMDEPGEQIRIRGEALLGEAFERASRVLMTRLPRDHISVFEFDALLAVQQGMERGCDVLVLEAGMGGREDAVNVWDGDAAILTSIGLDHGRFLGRLLSNGRPYERP